jgi:hypothetical protein
MKNALQEGRFNIPDNDGLHADLTSWLQVRQQRPIGA